MEGMTGCKGHINNGVSWRHRKQVDSHVPTYFEQTLFKFEENVDSWTGWHKTEKEDGKCKG